MCTCQSGRHTWAARAVKPTQYGTPGCSHQGIAGAVALVPATQKPNQLDSSGVRHDSALVWRERAVLTVQDGVSPLVNLQLRRLREFCMLLSCHVIVARLGSLHIMHMHVLSSLKNGCSRITGDSASVDTPTTAAAAPNFAAELRNIAHQPPQRGRLNSSVLKGGLFHLLARTDLLRCWYAATYY